MVSSTPTFYSDFGFYTGRPIRPDNFEFKQVPIECQVDIYGGADLEPKLRKIVHINITSDGYFNVTLHNFAYNCIKGRLMKECTNKDCSGAYSEIISALSKL